VFTHVRSFARLEPGSGIEALGEVIAAATVTGASMQIVHINNSCLKDGLECTAMVARTRARGVDVTTEAYPYTAGMTQINLGRRKTHSARTSGLPEGSIPSFHTRRCLSDSTHKENPLNSCNGQVRIHVESRNWLKIQLL
jgi:hypothetical protein